MKHLLLLVLLFVGCTSTSIVQEKSCGSYCRENCDSKFYMDDTHFVKVHTSHTSVDACVSKLVIVVHGMARNGPKYFERMTRIVDFEKLGSSVMVIALDYKTLTDSPEKNELYWGSSGWKIGNNSQNEDVKYSSFDVIDKIIEKYHYSIEDIVVVGHSAGGQFVNRYAFSSKEKNARFVVTNPSSYIYLDQHRVLDGQVVHPIIREKGVLSLKKGIDGDCPRSYNDYRYGVEEGNYYLLQTNVNTLIKNYLKKDVVYLLGDQDTEEEWLDVYCGAKVQGKHRFERGNNYYLYLNKIFPRNRHKKEVVPGVGHSSWYMFKSDVGKKVILE